MGVYDHSLSKYDLFFMFVVGEIRKIRLFLTVSFAKNLESAELTNNKNGKPTLHSPIADHVLEMSFKLTFLYEHFEKKQSLALMVLNTRCDFILYHTIFFSILLKLISEFKRICVHTTKTKLFQFSVYHHLYKFCKR